MLKSEIEVTCPCCHTSLVVDTNLGRVVSHRVPERGDKPELNEAARILTAEEARRAAMFQQSVEAEKGRGDALAAARLARLPGEVVLRMMQDRQAAEYDVAEERRPQVACRRHHPAHAELGAEFLCMA